MDFRIIIRKTTILFILVCILLLGRANENSETGAVIELSQTVADDAASALDIQNGIVKELNIDGENIKVYCTKSDEIFVAFWIEDKYRMKLVYSGSNNRDNLLDMVSALE